MKECSECIVSFYGNFISNFHTGYLTYSKVE